MSDKEQQETEQSRWWREAGLWVKNPWYRFLLVVLAIATPCICLFCLSPEQRVANNLFLQLYLGTLAVTGVVALCKPQIITSSSEKYFITRVLVTGITGGVFALLLPIAVKSTTTGVGGLRHSILLATGGLLAILTLGETRRKNDNDLKAANELQIRHEETLGRQKEQFEKQLGKQQEQFDANAFKERKAERRERYTKAVEQLGSKEASVRMGGVYTLVGLVDEWLEEESIEKYEDRLKEGQVIINNLCAYIRSPFTLASRYDELSQNTPTTEVIYKNDQQKSHKKWQIISNNLYACIHSRFTPDSPHDELSQDSYTAFYKDREQEFYADKATLESEADVRLSIIKEIHDRLQGPEENTPGTWSDFEYDFSGSTFFYPVDFTKSYYKKPVNFSGSTYKGKADFSSSTYEGKADFSGSTYQEDVTSFRSIYKVEANFAGSTYQGQANFAGSTYEKGVIFSASKVSLIFAGKVDYAKSTYQGQANFSGSTYKDWAIFSDSTYLGGADFSNSTYQGQANFSGSTYETKAETNFCYSIYEAETNFSNSTYEGWGQANFYGSIYVGRADFSNSAYGKNVTFSGTFIARSIYVGRADFTNSTYKDAADFSDSTYLDGADFTNSIYEDVAHFRDSIYEAEVNFSSSIYEDVAHFRNPTYKSWADFGGSIFYQEAYLGKGGNSNSSSRFTDCAPQFYDETNHKNTLFGSHNNDFMAITNERYPIDLNSEGLPLGCKFLTSEQKKYLEYKFQEIEKIKNKLLEAKDPKEKAELSKKLQTLNEKLHEWREEATTVKVEDGAIENTES